MLRARSRRHLLLDDVGCLPLESQRRLLHVLQGEFEPTRAVPTLDPADVRFIVGTTLDLGEKAVRGTFRTDLFYRLNLYPVTIPPLRERPEDIPILVRHFLRKFSSVMNKSIQSIPETMMERLQRRDWSRNERELEALIYQAVLLTTGDQLHDCLADAEPPGPAIVERSLADMERAHILQVLRETGGKIVGQSGAAAKLGMPRTLLQSRMRKLGIDRAQNLPYQ